MTHGGWPAPAKLNLFLHILGRRADGYHELQTAFQFIDLCDELHFEPRADGVIERPMGAEGVPAAQDLVVRAAERLRSAAVAAAGSEAAPALGATIRVHKRIPMQGGLGGGSSDAATTLVALNRLWNLEFTVDELAALGLELGADVPVFVHGHAAWAEGVGERLQAIDPPEPIYVVIRPDVAVSTGEIFQAAELTRNSPAITIRALSGSLPKKVEAGLFGKGTRNDCEPVVRARYPQVGAALDWLAGYAPSRLTGTGSCVFAAFDDERRARAVAAEVPSQWVGFCVRGRNRSPLLDRL